MRMPDRADKYVSGTREFGAGHWRGQEETGGVV